MLNVRGHGEGSLFQRRTGQWVAVVSMRNGRRVSRWSKSRDQAKADLAELLRLRDQGATQTGRLRLGSFLEQWANREHRLAPSTRRKHESAIRVHIGPVLGHHRLSELRVQDVDDALVWFRERGLGPQSVRHLRATLRRALADAVRDGLVTRNVAALSRAPGLTARERTILDATQARSLIESTRGTRYGPLWTILVTTGLRISEALGLAWSDVDMGGSDAADRLRGTPTDPRRVEPLQGGRRGVAVLDGESRSPSIHVRHQLAREDGEWVRRQPKTAKGRRTIPLTPLGVDALRAQRGQQRADRGALSLDGLVFTTERGRPIHGENLLPKLRADLAAAGLPKVGCHDLRHTAATLLYSMGIPMPAIADILGHADARITEQLYRHHVKAFSVEAAKRMQEALG